MGILKKAKPLVVRIAIIIVSILLITVFGIKIAQYLYASQPHEFPLEETENIIPDEELEETQRDREEEEEEEEAKDEGELVDMDEIDENWDHEEPIEFVPTNKIVSTKAHPNFQEILTYIQDHINLDFNIESAHIDAGDWDSINEYSPSLYIDISETVDGM